MIIRFPNLHFYVEGVPRAFRIFGAEFTMFGAMIALGMFLGLLVVWIQAGRQGKSINLILGAFIAATIGAIAGGRALYVACSDSIYHGDLVEILRINDGGMSVYGAILGAMLLVLLYSAVTRSSYLKTADVLVLGAAVTQAVGRWGDYFNRSSFGEYTNWYWAMQIPITDVRTEEVTARMRENLIDVGGVSYVQVTPVFLIESVLCLILFLWLLGCSRHRRYDGQIYIRYMTGYGLIRFACEWLRTDKLIFPGVKVGISLVLSLAFVIYFGLQGLIRSSLAKKREEIRRQAEEKYYEQSDFRQRIEQRKETARPDYTEQDKETVKARIQEEREAAYRKELDEKIRIRQEMRGTEGTDGEAPAEADADEGLLKAPDLPE